jgi:hypothetical protein
LDYFHAFSSAIIIELNFPFLFVLPSFVS